MKLQLQSAILMHLTDSRRLEVTFINSDFLKISGRKERATKPFRTSLLVLAAALLVSPCLTNTFTTQHAGAQAENSEFIVKPYIQLGNESKLQKSESVEIIWLAIEKDADAAKLWKVECDPKNNASWEEGKIEEALQMGFIAGQPIFRFTAKVTNLIPGKPFSYRLSRDGKSAFQSQGTARKSEKQPFRFAIVGDIGSGSSGQRKVAHQIALKKPDLFVIPGDIVYDRGLVSEYLYRFFPIMNSDTSSPSSGAPLLRSVLTMPVIGNHDVALTNPGQGVNLSRFPDALGYYLLWSSPLNGPTKLINAKNTTRLGGNAANQLSFVKAAGKRFPVMANYSFDYGNSHWIVLDGNGYMDWTDEKTRKWVDDDLAKAKNATWKFATFHQPGFSVDESHADEQRMRLLSDIFEKHNVDIVFAGHAHCYQRTIPLRFKPDLKKLAPGPYQDAVAGSFTFDKKFDGKTNTMPNGIIYIVTGGGGANLYQEKDNALMAPFIHKFVYAHSFSLVDINDRTLKMSQVTADGKVVDQFSLTKPGSVPLKIGGDMKLEKAANGALQPNSGH